MALRNLIREFINDARMSAAKGPKWGDKAARTLDNDWHYTPSVPNAAWIAENIDPRSASGMQLWLRREAARELGTSVVLISTRRGSRPVVLFSKLTLGEAWDIARNIDAETMAGISALHANELRLASPDEFTTEEEARLKAECASRALAARQAQTAAKRAPLGIYNSKVSSVPTDWRNARIEETIAKDNRSALNIAIRSGDFDLMALVELHGETEVLSAMEQETLRAGRVLQAARDRAAGKIRK